MACNPMSLAVTLCTVKKNKKYPENRDHRFMKLWAPTLTPSRCSILPAPDVSKPSADVSLTVPETSKSFAQKESDVLTVVSGGTRPRRLARDRDLVLSPSRFDPGASPTATEVQLTVAKCNQLHLLASTCTRLRNLHQKIFCRKNKKGSGLNLNAVFEILSIQCSAKGPSRAAPLRAQP